MKRSETLNIMSKTFMNINLHDTTSFCKCIFKGFKFRLLLSLYFRSQILLFCILNYNLLLADRAIFMAFISYKRIIKVYDIRSEQTINLVSDINRNYRLSYFHYETKISLKNCKKYILFPWGSYA